MPQRKLFVTTALPYANGKFHIGHMMEYIQADIWVRFQRMRGHAVHFVCADDAHGAPIMIAAEKAGKTPQAFVAEIAAGRQQYLDGFHVRFDNWHSTDSAENTELAQGIYQRLKAGARRAAAAGIAGPGGHPGNGSVASVAGLHPADRLFGQATPAPDPTLRPRPCPSKAAPRSGTTRRTRRPAPAHTSA